MNENNKHFDIAKVGSIPAQHTSRPVIAGRDTMVRDPMTVEEAGHAKDARLEKGHQKLDLKPSADVSGESVADKTLSTTASDLSSPPDQQTKVDDSITEPSIPPPHKAPDSPAQKLIRERTYHLPIHAHGTQSKISMVVYTLIVFAVVAGAVYVIIV